MTPHQPDHETHEETAPVDNKKVKVYLLLSVGLIMVVLGIMTVWDILTRPALSTNNPKQTAEPTKAVPLPIQEQSDFTQLVEQRTVSEVTRHQTKTPEQGPTNVYKEKAKQLEQAKQTQSTSKSDFAVLERQDPKQAAIIKWEIAEMQRAFAANQSSWKEDTPNARQPTQNTQPTSTSRQDVESRRLALAKRIEAMEKMRTQQVSSNGAQVPSLTSLSLTPTQQAKAQQLAQSFEAPPQDIAGYTKENRYDANIEGKYKLPIGTVVPAITAMKTVSDYAGTLKGFTTQDIYDIDYQHVLIPKGSEVIMKSVRMSNINEPIQARMGLTVPWIILPNGRKIDFSKSSGLDREGVGGVKDKVDYHFMAQFLGVAAYALLAGNSSYDGTGSDNDDTYVGNVSESAREQFAPLAQKYLSLTPTITIEAGQSMNIILEQELYLDAWSDIYEDYL